MSPEAPTAAVLQQHPAVQAAFAAAWADSLVDQPDLRHEEGGFVFVNPVSGEVFVRRALPGQLRVLDLTHPPVSPGCFLVATSHTHPNPIALAWDPEPSEEDRIEADDSGVPWFVVSEIGVFVAGPDRRTGGLSGPPGYPS